MTWHFFHMIVINIPACLLRHLQSVLNAGARLIFHLRRSDHITDALVSLATSARVHPIQDRHTDVQGSARHSATIPWTTRPSSNLHGQRALRSASSSRLVVLMFRLSTVGSRTFNVSGPLIWNGLPEDVSAPTFSSFRRRLKPFVFQQSYPDIVI